MKGFQLIRNDKGLTLVELMIVMVLSLLLMAAVYMTYQLQHGSGQSQLQVAATQQDLRVAMDIIALDIMHAGADPNLTQTIQGIPTDTSSQNTLSMVMDLNSDGDTNDTNENITYRLNAGNLERLNLNSGVTQIIANNVTQLDFLYRGRQADGTVYTINPTGPSNTLDFDESLSVLYIQVTMTKNSDGVDPQTNSPISRSLTRLICRRNGIPQA